MTDIEQARVWRPIETAPRDGTPILATTMQDEVAGWEKSWFWPVTVCWASYHPNAKGKEGWRTSLICGNKMDGVTHWMPLPPPPTPTGEPT
jgi:hypothetical protein